MSGNLSCWNCDNCAQDKQEDVCHNALKCFSFVVKQLNNFHLYSKGCIHRRDESQFYCKKSKHLFQPPEKKFEYGYDGFCCNTSDLCNDNTFDFNKHLNNLTNSPIPTSPKENDSPFPISDWQSLWPLIWIVTLPVLLLLGFALVKLCRRVRTNRSPQRIHKLPARIGQLDPACEIPLFQSPIQNGSAGSDQHNLKVTAAGDSTLRETFDYSITSGSGYGLPLLAQRTMSKEISLKECIGKGRFGEVWRAILFNEEVAVKVFFTKDEHSWKRESEIFNLYTLNHDAILKYHGSEVTSYNTCTQMWLITDYHRLGSLYDFLQNNSLSVGQALNIMNSAVSGLFHLHDEFASSCPKPGIAHRDLKSKNILMKSPQNVCLADFGLSVTKLQIRQKLYEQINIRQGTKRYMPPEVLDETIQLDNFEAYKMADVYSFAIVLWEVITRTLFNETQTCEYRLPYHQWVSGDPSFEQMQKVVCVDGQRPELPFQTIDICPTVASSDEIRLKQELLTSLCNLIKESWSEKPCSRLTTLRIKKDLQRLQSFYRQTNKQPESSYVIELPN